MPRRSQKVQVNRQQKHILLLALFLMKYKEHRPLPKKRDVIRYIDIKHLIAIRDWDREIVSNNEARWANSIAWRREDLKKEKCLEMPSRGTWKITDIGERRLLEWVGVLNQFAEKYPDWADLLMQLEDCYGEKVVITGDTMTAAQQALDLGNEKLPGSVPPVPENLKGFMRL